MGAQLVCDRGREDVDDERKAALPWVGVMFLFLIIVTYVPWVSTWLPTTLMGPEIITK
ncbi:hypothetical protein O9992_14620 [Vibrio lentus]|nr:hypothetical protein [Vibrio lentus]